MIMNIVIVVFLLLMAYWWAMQGLLSASLHALAAVLAGAFAFALWEPLTLGLLIKRMPEFAWGVGLVGPFVLLLILIRVVLDKLVPRDVKFHDLMNKIGGALFGALAGVLAAGVVLIGVGFMPWPMDLGGYQPLSYTPPGVVTREGGSTLWVPVDRITQGFYNRLSNGAFYNGTPLGLYVPDVVDQSALYRVRRDEDASLAAVPKSVKVDTVYTIKPRVLSEAHPSVEPVASKVRGDLVVVDTAFELNRDFHGTYDSDSTLRLSPTHVRLVTWRTDSEGDTVSEMHAPTGYSQVDPETNARFYWPINSNETLIVGVNPMEQIGFIFDVPAGQTPQFLLVRRLRLSLPGVPVSDPTMVAAAFGRVDDDMSGQGGGDGMFANGDGTGNSVGDRDGQRTGVAAVEVELSNKLEIAFSKNQVTAFKYDESEIRSGLAEIRKPSGAMSRSNRLDAIMLPSHQEMVRLKLDRDQASSLFGRVMVIAAQVGEMFLTDTSGQPWYATSYNLVRPDRTQLLAVDVDVRSAKQIPVNDMRPGDKLYLFFPVRKGATIKSFTIGSTTQEVTIVE